MTHKPTVLAVESSCDETAVAIYHPEQGILANEVFSQIPLHREHGGVVPELAARDHMRRLPILLDEALTSAKRQLSDIDVIAYTAGPGLLGALMTGAAFARSLAFSLNKPALGIHHMEGHLLSPMLGDEQPEYPFVALLVSGGHTQLMAVNAPGDYQMLGQTLDDAVGEAFDKTAKLMGLLYPGGPELAKLAEDGDPQSFKLSRPMVNRPGMDMSFSGLKTQVRLLIESSENSEAQARANIAASFQQTIADTLVIKCQRAWAHTGYRDLVVAGGVSANQTLRQALEDSAQKHNKRVFFPPKALCTDNALMIAYVGALRAQQAGTHDLNIDARARWPLSDIAAI
ncbi:tRNA (adenosine(37)-N6)-threonylcarbamoyltransferase complex transferase subunit TsaD [Suttonella sp. R2A3]|uniref:tRNA (adenosine(37)-N6)-threonylcarbamoyltransferase complex transferase subunit TsaD n=1 Tax=Suttonella sp. R2A3 TaxID=2908648 RepID=UPI001F1A3F18|nr:tRNA (adenosine(37)-N6)-threonylcarbamoyltransferase complex transferase subunit TsaD [Suttonella sp. R2A3]UJF24928.1 tRNA (adenosine(37)-N6)-threonylcarbamoyltransferase complex transferase subunit TsaD [Suttonella sp. R2A3]